MKKKASLKDIASLVGVSAAAVSYVLNSNGKQSKIGKDIAKKIKDTAKELNYQPNHIARSLKSGVTHTIGLIVEDISNPFFSNLASIIEKEAQDMGYTVVIGCHYENMEKSEKLLQTLLLRQVDGIILTPVDRSEAQVKQLRQSGTPFVLMDRYFSQEPSSTVTINNSDISYKAVSHLIEQGYRRTAMITFDSSFEHINDRVEGYLRAMKDHRLKGAEKWVKKVSFSHLENDIDKVVHKLLAHKNRPDSLFFANNIIATKSIEVVNQLNIKVPEELGLVSFDSRDVFNYFYAPVSYIEQNLKEVGERALQTLLGIMKTKTDPLKNIVIDAELIIRKSSTRMLPEN